MGGEPEELVVVAGEDGHADELLGDEVPAAGPVGGHAAAHEVEDGLPAEHLVDAVDVEEEGLLVAADGGVAATLGADADLAVAEVAEVAGAGALAGALAAARQETACTCRGVSSAAAERRLKTEPCPGLSSAASERRTPAL